CYRRMADIRRHRKREVRKPVIPRYTGGDLGIRAQGLGCENAPIQATLHSMTPENSSTQLLLEETVEHAKRYIAQLESDAVAPAADLEELRRTMSKPLPETSIPPSEVIADLVRD